MTLSSCKLILAFRLNNCGGRVLGLLCLILVAGCGHKPSPSLGAESPDPGPSTGVVSPAPTDNNPRRPTGEDLAAHFRHLVPAALLDVAVQADPPVPDPDTPGGWLMQAKVVFTPRVDLCSLPQPKDVQEANDLVKALNRLYSA